MHTQLTIFDLDHTLLNVNSSYCFGAYLYHHKNLSFFQLIYCLFCYARHQWLGLSVFDLHQKVFKKLFKGYTIQEIERKVSAFLDQKFDQMLYQPVIERLKQAQGQGHYTVILSSSPDFLVGPIASRLGVNEWRASMYKKGNDGKFHEIIEVMEGQNKADYATLLIKRLNIDFARLSVYSDSYLDLPMLEIAGKAIGVLPDRYLRKVCTKNKWEII